MNVVVVGSGGREHALAWRLAACESVSEVMVTPGNPGIDRQDRCRGVPGPVNADSVAALHPDLVIIGPEAPLVAGLADELRRRGLLVVGPSAAAAALEGSKQAAKELMERHRIPTAGYRVCSSPEAAEAALVEFGAPLVVKADGLAAGKGVSVCTTLEQARTAIREIMVERRFDAAGDTVVVEQFLPGFEASIIVLVDESGYLVLPTARDHKQIYDRGQGPNTGGMGVVAPNPDISPELLEHIHQDIVKPSVAAVQELTRRDPSAIFRGFLFIGLMIDQGRAQVLEYNVRFGDPEAQAILPLVEGDFAVLLLGLAGGNLAGAIPASEYRQRPGFSCAVVAASAGYPGVVRDGVPVYDPGEPGMLFWAGVKQDSEAAPLLTSGGRILATVATGADLESARRDAYRRLLGVQFSGMQYRRDIGGEALTGAIIEEETRLLPQFHKRGGLLPVVVQDVASGDVLMVGYANRDALNRTLETGLATFWSTSRGVLWTKGETSGDTLQVEEVRLDCDQDALLYRVTPQGEGVCHTTDGDGHHRRRCFYRVIAGGGNAGGAGKDALRFS